MLLPTPDTSHVAYDRVYEPAEDSFLLLDTLSSASETAFLTGRFRARGAAVFVVEIGPGSGVVIAFLNAHAQVLFGPSASVLAAAVDVNSHACGATSETARKAAAAASSSSSHRHGHFLGAVQGDLALPLRDGSVDVLIFNPPYVPTSEMPSQPATADWAAIEAGPTYEHDSYLLSLSYAGGKDGMETTDRLLHDLARVLAPEGCAYVLLCARNKPEAVKQRIRGFGHEWRAETVGTSGRKAGWEKLQIVRIWRQSVGSNADDASSARR